jgi:hypothetical protein
MGPMAGTFEVLTETFAGAMFLGALFWGALLASCLALLRGIGRLRGGRRRETLFVARWGERGPEIYRVGKVVRRLPRPQTTLEHARELLPPEGLVLSKADVKAWLRSLQATSSKTAS